MFSKQAREFFIFQMVNFLVSFLVWAISPLSVNGINLIYPLFSLKVIALLWFNGYPQNRSFFSLLFFLFACADVFVFYLFGSFSIYSLAFSYLL